jgi:hypothetical protein
MKYYYEIVLYTGHYFLSDESAFTDERSSTFNRYISANGSVNRLEWIKHRVNVFFRSEPTLCPIFVTLLEDVMNLSNRKPVLRMMGMDTSDKAPITDSTRKLVVVFHFIYSILGLFLGLACVIGGVILFFGGITGSSQWTAKVLGFESTMSDAAPGIILFVVGVFIVFITRFSYKEKIQSN